MAKSPTQLYGCFACLRLTGAQPLNYIAARSNDSSFARSTSASEIILNCRALEPPTPPGKIVLAGRALNEVAPEHELSVPLAARD